MELDRKGAVDRDEGASRDDQSSQPDRDNGCHQVPVEERKEPFACLPTRASIGTRHGDQPDQQFHAAEGREG